MLKRALLILALVVPAFAFAQSGTARRGVGQHALHSFAERKRAQIVAVFLIGRLSLADCLLVNRGTLFGKLASVVRDLASRFCKHRSRDLDCLFDDRGATFRGEVVTR